MGACSSTNEKSVQASSGTARKDSKGSPKAGIKVPPKPRREDIITADPMCNVPDEIYACMGRGLHLQPSHPVAIVKQAIYDFLDRGFPGAFTKFDDLSPVVSTSANFDELHIRSDHPSRAPTSAFYTSKYKCLRWHTAAHLRELLQGGEPAWVVTGDVYRHDKADDAQHMHVFHQLDGVRVFGEKEWKLSRLTPQQHARLEVKTLLEDLCKAILGNIDCRWSDVSLPYSDPSFSLQVYVNHSWVDVGRCGVLDQGILEANWHPPARNGAGKPASYVACTFGLGLERLAMVLFGIPHIQLFWSDDPRFLGQFKAGDMTTRFKPYNTATAQAVQSLGTITVAAADTASRRM